MRTEIVGDEVEIRGECGVKRLRVDEELVLRDPNVSVLNTENMSVGNLVVTNDVRVVGDLEVEGATGVSVDTDLSVGGATSTGSLSVGGNASITGILTSPKLRVEHAMLRPTSYTGVSDGDYVTWGSTISNTGIATYNSSDSSVTLAAGKYNVQATVSLYSAGGGSYFEEVIFASLYKNSSFLYSVYASGDKMYREAFVIQDVVESDGTDKIKVKVNFTLGSGSAAISERSRLYIQKLE